MTVAPEVLQWARETLRGINVLTGHGRGRQGGGTIDAADFPPDVAEFVYGIERQLIGFLEAHKTTDPEKWVSDE